MTAKYSYIIYKTQNLVNGKIYIGKHATKNINDGYLGSGLLLTKAIRKYGRKNFSREILHIFECEEDMENKEKELVTEQFCDRTDTYNIAPGGQGGAGPFRNMSADSRTKRAQRSAETIKLRNIWTPEKRLEHKDKSLAWQKDESKRAEAYRKSSNTKKGQTKNSNLGIQRQIASRAAKHLVFKNNLINTVNNLLLESLTVKDIAIKCSVSPSTIYRIKAGTF